MTDDNITGECVCISAYTEYLGEMGVPEGYGALIISVNPDKLGDMKVGTVLFKDVVLRVNDVAKAVD